MNKKDLSEYLSICVDMEREIFLQNEAIKELNSRMDKLGIKGCFTEPKEPIKPGDPDNGFMVVFIVLGIPFMILGIWLIRYFVENPDVFSFLMAFFGLCMAMTGFAYVIYAIKENIEENDRYVNSLKSYDHQISQYKTEMKQYLKDMDEDKKRLDKEEREKLALQFELKQLNEQNTRSKKNLAKIYALNIVYPKYRSLPMLSSLCEYVASGRCDTLEGASGAYNILETEMRLDKIITQLEKVVANLQAIRNNQFMLYRVMEEGNRKLDNLYCQVGRLVDGAKDYSGDINRLYIKLNELNANSELQAYNEQRIQRELQFMNRMNYFAGNYGKNATYYELP